MSSIFEVNGTNRFEDDKKMTISVYGVRPSKNPMRVAEFLVYYNGRWIWTDAYDYTPINNKHS